MAELHLISTAAEVKAAFNAADAYARVMPKRDADGGWIPIAARRADALIALVAGTTGGASSAGSATASTKAVRPKTSVQVTMDLATLLGLRDNPAELAGYGPIPASAARALAADGKWRRLIHDPLTGALLDLGTTSYEPSAAMERYIRSRDARCAFPSCGQPAHRCEIDHTNPYREGVPETGTDRCNLGCLCEYHHDLKHHAGWALRRDPSDHTVTWTSTTVHHFLVSHHDHRGTAAMIRPPAIADGAEIRWSDEILTDYDWDNIDWNDREYRVAPLTPPAMALTATPAAVPADVCTTPAGDQCPF
jgi:hypothetical protein